MTDLLALEASGTRLSRTTRGRQPAGASRSRRLRARGMEYAESRPYQSGDDVRSIDWRVTARTVRTHTKLYEEERERPVWLCLDLRASMRFATRNAFKSVLAAHVSALLGWAALACGDRIGCVCWTDAGIRALPPRRGRAALTSALGLMVRSDLRTAASSMRAVADNVSASQVIAVTGAGAQVWVLSDFMAFPEQRLGELAALGRRHRLTLVQTIDPFEDDPPPVSGGLLIDASGTVARFDPSELRSENTPARKMLEQLLLLGRRPGVELAVAHTTQAPEAIALRLLQAAAPLRPNR